MWNLKVNNTTAAPNGSTSRPDPDGNCRPMAGSEGHPEQTKWSESDNLWHLGNSTTSTAYSGIIPIDTIICYYTLIDTASYYVTILLSNNNLRHYIPIDTASFSATIPPNTIISSVIQQEHNSSLYQWEYRAHWYNNPLRHYTSPDTATYYVIILYWYNLILYYPPIDIAIYYVTIFLLIQQTNMLLYFYCYSHPIRYYILLMIQPSIPLIYLLVQQSIINLSRYSQLLR